MWVGCSESGTADARQGRGGADEEHGGEALRIFKLKLDTFVPPPINSCKCCGSAPLTYYEMTMLLSHMA